MSAGDGKGSGIGSVSPTGAGPCGSVLPTAALGGSGSARKDGRARVQARGDEVLSTMQRSPYLLVSCSRNSPPFPHPIRRSEGARCDRPQWKRHAHWEGRKLPPLFLPHYPLRPARRTGEMVASPAGSPPASPRLLGARLGGLTRAGAAVGAAGAADAGGRTSGGGRGAGAAAPCAAAGGQEANITETCVSMICWWMCVLLCNVFRALGVNQR